MKPLYRKRGWLGENFDGDAFLMDQARADAAGSVKYHAEHALQYLTSLKHLVETCEQDKGFATSQRQRWAWVVPTNG